MKPTTRSGVENPLHRTLPAEGTSVQPPCLEKTDKWLISNFLQSRGNSASADPSVTILPHTRTIADTGRQTWRTASLWVVLPVLELTLVDWGLWTRLVCNWETHLPLPPSAGVKESFTTARVEDYILISWLLPLTL